MNPSVMVVDDSAMIRQQVSNVLTLAGYAVREASDGKQALNQLAEVSNVSLIILDVNMPNMNGIELLENLKDHPSYEDVPVVMLTTEGQAGLMKKAKSLGAKGWIIKPFDPDLLTAAVRKLTRPRV